MEFGATRSSVFLPCLGVAVFLWSATGCGGDADGGERSSCDAEAQWKTGKRAHAKYKDPWKAWEDGHRGISRYVVSPFPDAKGNMGIHAVNHDFARRGVNLEHATNILYNLDEEGNYQLAGADYFIPASHVPDENDVPTLLCQKMNGPMPGHIGPQPDHYELHAWYFEKAGPGEKFAITPFLPSLEAPSYIDDHNLLFELSQHERDTAEKVRALGYSQSSECRDGKGIEFTNPDIDEVELRNPHAYHFRKTQVDGEVKYSLLAAKWSVPASEYDEPPTLLNQTFQRPEDPVDGDGDVYVLYDWMIFNPDGLFAQSHRGIECR